MRKLRRINADKFRMDKFGANKFREEETHCHPERALCAKNLSNSSVFPSVLCGESL